MRYSPSCIISTEDLRQPSPTKLSKRVSIATPELRSFGASEMSYVNGLGFNFDVAPSLVGIWCPLIYEVGDVGDVGGSE